LKNQTTDMTQIETFIKKNKDKIYCDLSTDSFDHDIYCRKQYVDDGVNELTFEVQCYPVFDYSHNMKTLMDVNFQIMEAQFWINEKWVDLKPSEIEFLKPYIYE